MVAETEKPRLSLEEFMQIRDFIHEKTGVYLGDKKLETLEYKLQNRLRLFNFKSFSEYYYLLKYGLQRQEELGVLIDLITIKETKFFRNPPQIEALKEKILPEIRGEKLQKKDTTLRLWSAGCATGEEPYTLAIVICEIIPFFQQWNIEILANDISHSALAVAREGVYRKDRLADMSENYIKKYFLPEGNNYRIKPFVKKMVNFQYLNLTWPDALNKILDIDIIFCRNVLIYFSETAKNKTIRHFYNSLRNGGYYFTGHAETIDLLVSPFKSIILGGTFVYRKE